MASERIVLRIDEKGAKVVSRNIEKVGRSARQAGGGVKLLRSALGALGAVSVGLVLRNMTKTLADFSQEMSTVKAITGATGKTFDELKMKARDLGANTRFSATEAAQGMTFLARAGFDTNAVLASIEPTLQLAQAGALELGRAADIASNVLTGFNIEASDSQRVIDVLALAANSANTNVEQLGEAMSYVAPVSATLGVSLEETAAGIQVLSDAGIQASRAGTNLTMVMRKLEAPQGKQKSILKDLNLGLEDVRVSEVGLTQALLNLKKAGASQAQIFDLFGRSAAAASVLLKGADGKIQGFTASNEKAAGTAKRVAEVMDDNLNGALLAVRSAWQELQLAFGDQGAESFMTKTFKGLAAVLRNMAANVDKFTKPMNEFFVFMKDVGVATFQTLKPVVIDIVAAFQDWGVTGESLKMTLDDVGLALLAMLRTAAQVVDGTIASFNILGKVIAVAIFGGIEDSKHFWQQGLHWMVEKFKRMLANIVIEINKISGALGIQEISIKSLLPEAAPKTEAFDWGFEMGKAVADGWITPITDVLDDVIAKVEDAQLKRSVQALRSQIGGGGADGGTGFGPFIPEGPAKEPLGPYFDEAKKGIDEVSEAAGLAENATKKSFDTMTDSLVNFTQTGKLEVRSMVSDILSQLARLAAMNFLKGAAGGLGLPGFATGGSFVVGGSGGTDSQTVAFNATPGERVSIQTPGQQHAMGATPSTATPQMNVKIVNVLDPSVVIDAMASEDGEEVIVNTIQKNGSTVRQAIS